MGKDTVREFATRYNADGRLRLKLIESNLRQLQAGIHTFCALQKNNSDYYPSCYEQCPIGLNHAWSCPIETAMRRIERALEGKA